MKILARLKELGFTSLLLACSAVLAEASPPPRQDRAAVPTHEVRDEALKELRDTFRASYAARDVDSRRNLARDLVKTSATFREESLNDYYTYLYEAHEIASQVGEIEAGFAAINLMNEVFEVDGRALKVSFVKKVAGDVRADERCAVLSEVLPLIGGCVEQEEYGSATELLGSLADFWESCEDKGLEEAAATASHVCAEFRKVERYKRKLESNPEDTRANDRVGRFYCFVRADFETGLSMLARSGSRGLRLLAVADLAMGGDSEAQLKLGESWLEYAEGCKKGDARATSASRAAYWFERSLQGLTTNRSKLKAEQRLKTALELSIKAPKPMAKPATRKGPVAASARKSGGALVPDWAELVGATPSLRVVTDRNLRKRIVDTGWAWHVRDKVTGIEMLLVPPGSYRRGASEGDADAKEQELPAHEVLVSKAFYLGRFETQTTEWLHIMEGEPLSTKRGLPRTWINWPDVLEFLGRANRGSEQPPLRLPTEAEWELACRAGTTGPRYSPKLKDIGWYEGNSRGRLHPVGELQANPLGFHDMLGNGSEWCADTWEKHYYQVLAGGVQEISTDPFNGGGAADWKHVLRGGAFDKKASLSRASFRQHGFPVPHKGPYVIRVARHP